MGRIFWKRHRLDTIVYARSRFNKQNKHKRKIEKKRMRRRFESLKTEMEEISKDQERIKEGQRQVREKLESIEEQCEQLRKETKEIIQQSATTQIRLALMFNILKARQEGNFVKASQLTQLLGEITARA